MVKGYEDILMEPKNTKICFFKKNKNYFFTLLKLKNKHFL
jgi:hypothetical protein